MNNHNPIFKIYSGFKWYAYSKYAIDKEQMISNCNFPIEETWVPGLRFFWPFILIDVLLSIITIALLGKIGILGALILFAHTLIVNLRGNLIVKYEFRQPNLVSIVEGKI
jgi:hypothetical protein